MQCVLCGSDNYEKLFSVDGFEIKKCLRCGLARTFGKQDVSYSHYHRDADYKLHEKYFRNIFMKRFVLMNRFITAGRVLDIGAATGTLLQIFMDHGWEAHGVEPSSSAGEVTRRGIKVTKSIFEKANLPENYFDAVVINHTLEHVANPLEVLIKIKTVLKKGGIVYVDLPNFGSLSSQLMTKNWALLLPNEHVYHFTPDTLKKIIKKAGLKVIWSETWSGIYDVDSVFGHFWTQLTSGKPYMYKNFVFDVLGIPGNILATSLNMGTSLAVIGKK
ncbi:hypothetical protein A3F62_03975 [Candidatus Woesebacteria bacterium RIFCSPHIGHO2_12_FULL_44_11]|nr:MAG: hypothetical protein A3F62_03975 [Candidatus Woesebacteria bacterium RIFCSPHIGHO2_12_FULL_44_11]